MIDFLSKKLFHVYKNYDKYFRNISLLKISWYVELIFIFFFCTF